MNSGMMLFFVVMGKTAANKKSKLLETQGYNVEFRQPKKNVYEVYGSMKSLRYKYSTVEKEEEPTEKDLAAIEV